jgi:DNA-binding MarR family transcriptional regulator
MSDRLKADPREAATVAGTASVPREELLAGLTRQARLFQIASDKMDDAFCRRVGINPTDGRCLDLLDVHDGMTAGELAAAASLSPGAITTVLDRLERIGLVTRERDELDRRRVIVQPTDEARRLAFEIYGPIGAYARPYLDGLSREELELIGRFLEVATEVNERRAGEVHAEPAP